MRLLRRFKQELYDFTITNETTANLRVAALEDERVADEELVLAIGKAKDLGLKGLSGISGNEWYRNVVLNDLPFSNGELIEYAMPSVINQFTRKIPIHKYLAGVKREHSEAVQIADEMNFDSIICESDRKRHRYLEQRGYDSVKQIWEQEKANRDKAFRIMAYLKEDEFDLHELESLLQEIFEEDVNVFDNVCNSEKTGIRRLIRIYDYLKWGNAKKPSN